MRRRDHLRRRIEARDEGPRRGRRDRPGDEAVTAAGNVHYDTDIKLADLRRFYDALIFSTGARADRGLKANQATDVHVFARRGPAQIKFTPDACAELGRVDADPVSVV